MPNLCAAVVFVLQCAVLPVDGAGAIEAQAGRPADAWYGEDKVRHFAASYAVVAFGYGGAVGTGLDQDAALAVAVVASAIAGVAKEFYDQHTYGLFSYRDLVWDAAGILAGAALVRRIR